MRRQCVGVDEAPYQGGLPCMLPGPGPVFPTMWCMSLSCWLCLGSSWGDQAQRRWEAEGEEGAGWLRSQLPRGVGFLLWGCPGCRAPWSLPGGAVFPLLECDKRACSFFRPQDPGSGVLVHPPDTPQRQEGEEAAGAGPLRRW